jgi:hypothetical protein
MPDRRFAFDLDVLRRLADAAASPVVPIDGDQELVAAVRLYLYGGQSVLLPSVESEFVEIADRAALDRLALQPFEPDDFFRGCAKAKMDEYLSLYPDARDCRVVGEAECARVEAVLTLKLDLLNGLAERTSMVQIATPSMYWERLRIPPDSKALRRWPLEARL